MMLMRVVRLPTILRCNDNDLKIFNEYAKDGSCMIGDNDSIERTLYKNRCVTPLCKRARLVRWRHFSAIETCTSKVLTNDGDESKLHGEMIDAIGWNLAQQLAIDDEADSFHARSTWNITAELKSTSIVIQIVLTVEPSCDGVSERFKTHVISKTLLNSMNKTTQKALHR